MLGEQARAPARAPRCAGCAAPAAACGTARARPGSAGSARRGGAAARSSDDRAVGRRRPAASATSSHRIGHAPRRSLARPAREQLLAQLAPGPVQPHLGRRLGDAQLGGDGLVGQVVDVAQHDHGPQPGRQVVEGVRRAGRAARPASAGASGSCSGRSSATAIVVGRARRGGAGARLPRWVDAQFAVIRYSQVVNWASPRNRFRPR